MLLLSIAFMTSFVCPTAILRMTTSLSALHWITRLYNGCIRQRNLTSSSIENGWLSNAIISPIFFVIFCVHGYLYPISLNFHGNLVVTFASFSDPTIQKYLPQQHFFILLYLSMCFILRWFTMFVLLNILLLFLPHETLQVLLHKVGVWLNT